MRATRVRAVLQLSHSIIVFILLCIMWIRATDAISISWAWLMAWPCLIGSAFCLFDLATVVRAGWKVGLMMVGRSDAEAAKGKTIRRKM